MIRLFGILFCFFQHLHLLFVITNNRDMISLYQMSLHSATHSYWCMILLDPVYIFI